MSSKEDAIDFHFPGTPYEVQRQLMSALYEAIENKRIGIFESPTGTGKTLSIICGTLTWMVRNRLPLSSTKQTTKGEVDVEDPPWVMQQTEDQRRACAWNALRFRARAYDLRVRNANARAVGAQPLQRKFSNRKCVSRSNLDDLFGDLDSDSDDEAEKATKKSKKRNSDSLGWTDDYVTANTAVRIIFATRTHSQIAQFVQELRKTVYNPPTLTEASVLRKNNEANDSTSVLNNGPPLSIAVFGSRKQMCVNESVRSLGHASAIAERCRELTEGVDPLAPSSRKRSRARCTFHDEDVEEALGDRLLIGVHEIEEAANLGRTLGGCPYYATRSAVASGNADVIIAPYAAVLHAATRKSLGMNIDANTIVVFDEAHNIPTTVRDLHSCSLSMVGLEATICALGAYEEKYRDRLSTTNLFRVRQAKALANGFAGVLRGGGKERVIRAEDLVFEAGVDNINVVALTVYLQESGLCKKLRGFINVDTGRNLNADAEMNTTKNRQNGTTTREYAARQSIVAFERFVECLCACSSFGRVALYPAQIKPCESHLKYFVVEHAALFAESMREARAILLVGGTLSPRATLTEGLLRDMNRGNVMEFECEHVVPADHVMTRICGTGPGGGELEFTFRSRGCIRMIDELGESVTRCVQGVRGGVVVFFASYDLLETVTRRWDASGARHRLHAKKPVVTEVRGGDSALRDYQALIERDVGRGATLLAVMGGKLSEGINFTDDLGRLVIMVGMPFGNAMHIETSEMLRSAGGSSQSAQLLENECMTVVNQCVGRAVRHRMDFAGIILMDKRFSRRSTMEQLPQFVKRNLRCCTRFDEVQREIHRFFHRHVSNHVGSSS